MAYENAEYINELDKNLPQPGDTISEGDIHLRTIKETLKQSFPNVDNPVNCIHTGSTPPTHHSAGTVWFDTSSGLVKMRDIDDTQWLNMAHGQSGGLGSTLKLDVFNWSGGNYRNDTPELKKDWSMNPLSDNSTIIVTLSGQANVWGGLERQESKFKLSDVTNGFDITGDITAIGFNHVNDANNFEIYSYTTFKGVYKPEDRQSGPFDLGLYGWTSSANDGGSGITGVTVEALEIE